MVSAPYFVATKLEAFDGRGKGDYRVSHDLEDLLAVVDGRRELAPEVRNARDDLRDFIAERVARLLADTEFIDAVPGHLPGDDANQARIPLVLARLRAIAGIRE